MKSDLDPEAIGRLQTVWMKIYGVPSFAKIESVIKEVATLAAEPLLVDELSMIRNGPVKVKVRCRDPSQIRGFVEIFFNGIGYEVRFLVEGFKNTSKGEGLSGGGGKNDHDRKDDKYKKDSEDSDDDDYDVDDTKTEWEKFQEREMENAKQDQMQKDEEKGEHDPGFIQELPLASFDPTKGNVEIFREGAQFSKGLMDNEQELRLEKGQGELLTIGNVMVTNVRLIGGNEVNKTTDEALGSGIDLLLPNENTNEETTTKEVEGSSDSNKWVVVHNQNGPYL